MGLAFPKYVIRSRQERIFELLPYDSVFIVFSPSPVLRSGDVEFRYRPSSRVLYLSGIKDPDTYLIFSKKRLKDGVEKKVWVLRKDVPDDMKVWIGEPTSESEIKEVADEVLGLDKLEETLTKLSENTKYLFFPISENENFDKIVLSIFSKLKRRARAGVLPPHSFSDADQILGKLRIQKDEYEVSLIRRAVSITKQGIDELKRKEMIKKGVFEYEIDAEILSFYMKFGGWEGFPTIVASGKNSIILHYTKNNSPLSFPCVVDTGAEINYYSADITRTFVEEFSDSTPSEKEILRLKRAREIMQGVLEIQKKVIENVKAGVSFQELNSLAEKLITEFLIDYGILKGSVEENLMAKSFRVFYPHRIGHHLGLDVHDVCPYFKEDSEPYPIPENAVITIEPGIYIPDKDVVFIPYYDYKDVDGEKVKEEVQNERKDVKKTIEIKIPEELRGIGVRIEDDILVKKIGFEIL